MDRCYRIGQSKDVTVIRYCTSADTALSCILYTHKHARTVLHTWIGTPCARPSNRPWCSCRLRRALSRIAPSRRREWRCSSSLTGCTSAYYSLGLLILQDVLWMYVCMYVFRIMLMVHVNRVKLLFNISEKDVVDELEKMEEEGWHTLMEDA